MSQNTDPKSFPITTLRDIYNLPTFEQMIVCLDELKETMIQARDTNDLMVAIANENGVQVGKAMEWPDVIQWKDDGKGEIGIQCKSPDGKEIFSMVSNAGSDARRAGLPNQTNG